MQRKWEIALCILAALVVVFTASIVLGAMYVFGELIHDWHEPVGHIKNEQFVVAEYSNCCSADESSWGELTVVDLNSWRRDEKTILVLYSGFNCCGLHYEFVDDNRLRITACYIGKYDQGELADTLLIDLTSRLDSPHILDYSDAALLGRHAPEWP